MSVLDYIEEFRARLAHRFWSKVNLSDLSGCWLWKATAGTNGYGQFQLGTSGRTSSHRAAFEWYFGRIPRGKLLRHKCDNRRCVRPDHLEIGTQAQNIADMIARDRHLSGSRSPNAKLTVKQVAEIRCRYIRGVFGIPKLAREFGVGRSTIDRIVNGKTWRVPGAWPNAD